MPLPHLRETRDGVTRSVHTLDQENVSATLTVAVPAVRVFAALADPTSHSVIDVTGWVQEATDQAPLTEVEQIFRMDMYHPTIHTELPGSQQGSGPRPAARHRLADGAGEGRGSPGVRRMDLALRPGAAWPVGDRGHAHPRTSTVPQSIREYIQFPPFGPEHLANSLQHLAELAEPTSRAWTPEG